MPDKDPILYGIEHHAATKAVREQNTAAGVEGLPSLVNQDAEVPMTCEQRRAIEYGIDERPSPAAYTDPTAFNAATCEHDSPVVAQMNAMSDIERMTDAIEAAAEAHHKYELHMREALDDPEWSDPAWAVWYARHIVYIQKFR